MHGVGRGGVKPKQQLIMPYLQDNNGNTVYNMDDWRKKGALWSLRVVVGVWQVIYAIPCASQFLPRDTAASQFLGMVQIVAYLRKKQVGN